MRFVLLVWACSALAADLGRQAEVLADRARTLPAEFAADGLIRIAESGKIAEAARRRVLLEDAFHLAAAAQQPLKRSAVVLRSGPTAFKHRAFPQGLDRLSLQARAVNALIALDKAKARELFMEIPSPQLERLSCADDLLFDVSPFYDVLPRVLQSTFTAKENSAEENIHFIERYLPVPQFASQVGPTARALAAMKLRPEQLELLTARFQSALKELVADPRSFTLSSSRGSREPEAIAELARACQAAGIPTVALIEAYRSYLVKNLKGPQCADGAQRESIAFGLNTGAGQRLNLDAVGAFNSWLLGEAQPTGQVKPIAADETQSSGVEEATAEPPDCSGTACGQLAAQYRALLLDAQGGPVPMAQKATPEWQAKLKTLLAGIAQWTAESGAAEARQFRVKSGLFNELSNVAPNGSDRADVLRGYLVFLEGSSYRQEHRMEWLLGVNSLIGRAFTDSTSLAWLGAELKASHDPVIAFYASLEELSPRPPDQFLRLL